MYTSNVNQAFEAMRDIATGILYINAGTIGSEVQLPFGGTRGTGNGHREGGGPPVLEVFTEWKSIYVDYSGRLQRAKLTPMIWFQVSSNRFQPFDVTCALRPVT